MSAVYSGMHVLLQVGSFYLHSFCSHSQDMQFQCLMRHASVRATPNFLIYALDVVGPRACAYAPATVRPHGNVEYAIRQPTSNFEASHMHGAVLPLGLGAG